MARNALLFLAALLLALTAGRAATWDPTALPADYQDYLRRWWEWHHVRLVAMFAATCSVFVAMLARK